MDSEVIKILAESERRGMLINQDDGFAFEAKMVDEMKKLKTQAALMAGTNFDLNKPNEVKTVRSQNCLLFKIYNRLSLQVIFTKLKLGDPKSKPSSSKEALQALSDKHPLPNIIIEYRKLHHIITVVS